MEYCGSIHKLEGQFEFAYYWRIYSEVFVLQKSSSRTAECSVEIELYCMTINAEETVHGFSLCWVLTQPVKGV
jgi:hypothetical protein